MITNHKLKKGYKELDGLYTPTDHETILIEKKDGTYITWNYINKSPLNQTSKIGKNSVEVYDCGINWNEDGEEVVTLTFGEYVNVNDIKSVTFAGVKVPVK